MSLLKRLRSEFIYLVSAIRILGRVSPIVKNRTRTFPDILDTLADRYADNVALLSDRTQLTYRQLQARANQYARWARSLGIGKGDTVALMMPNEPEYLAVWMGVIRVGGVCALINTNLSGAGLAHCLNIVNARQILVGGDLVANFESALTHIETPPRLWVAGKSHPGGEPIEVVLEQLPDGPLPDDEKPDLTIDDPALYIYTSGTTGLPKAAVINHYRVQAIMAGFAAACHSGESDRIYIAQPLYHTAGGVLAPGIALMNGGSCFIREKFSARQFWDDVVAYDCTMFQYIGELCRYLLNAPTHPNETRHKIRLCNGNGLRPDIWTDFQERFRIPRIIEWYAATEGNVTIFNLDGTPGAIGRIPKWLEKRFMTRIIRFDVESETVVRGADGFCIECKPGETGEAIGRILIDPKAPAQRFDGYADKSATEKKILRDVFETGDAWFRTGDLLKKDAVGYFYFIDRIGDTFRWKGENVSTSEVAETINVFPGVREANVYGVHVPGHDGRAGMAAIAADDDLDLAGLREHINAQLPPYARPLFVRIRKEMEVTTTFKQKKVDLRNDGFDPARISDDLYFNDPDTARFELIDPDLFGRIQSRAIRL
ncbi:long-chain-acyl-CoA synthetase [Microbaculum marinisediminis]|uniref:Long-chain-acyl-CoA synthetase n=1 Tax=Microbaculum marinisediminis TaxID=2931392 RepID=A0AAW5R438_9HYPH|nr:long-chain-acyl-CoA synthetase [Microbaculum sp. A6E488]MCT8974559.1 long-chain-acyl-CoA synthetase [Microbaculum sp. A6E488]